jgi:phytoene desaturase
MAPSGFIGYLGVKGKLPQLEHHNLIFSLDWRKNFGQIFDYPQWPDDPSMYVCMPSAVDPSTAPEGHENIFIFVPIASGLPENESIRQEFAKKILAVIAKEANILDLEERIVYKQWFSGKGFETKYNSFKGSALGLAHTLWQTAIFRPNNVSKKIKNLFYVGGNTNPGIGLPMCLISAELALKRIIGDRSSGPLTKS